MTIKQGFPDRLFRSSVVPSDFLAVNEYSDLALAETNARGNPVAANGATRSALADATAPISENTRSMAFAFARLRAHRTIQVPGTVPVL